MSISKKLLFEDYDNFSTEEDYTTSAEAQDYFRNMDEMVTALIDIGLWQPSTQYTKGAVVKSPSMPSGTEAICVAENGGTSSNVEPSWGEVGGDNVSDGTCFWQLRYTGTVTEKMVGYPQRSTAYALNAIVACPYQPGLLLKCTQAGMTTMAALDTASVAVGEVLEDGTVKWEVIVLPIELGGTGATSAVQARDNLGMIYATSKNITLNRMEEKVTAAQLKAKNVFAAHELISGVDFLPTADYYHVITTVGNDTSYTVQLALGMTTEAVYYRNQKSNVWGEWEKLAFESMLPDTLPVGTVITYVGDIPPTGFLDCNGAGLKSTTYTNLYSVIGTKYGTGDGVDTDFNLPNIQNGKILNGASAQVLSDGQGMTLKGVTSGNLGVMYTDDSGTGNARGLAVTGVTGRFNAGEYVNISPVNNNHMNADLTNITVDVKYCIKY